MQSLRLERLEQVTWVFRAEHSCYSFLPEVCLLILIESVYQGQNTEYLSFSSLNWSFLLPEYKGNWKPLGALWCLWEGWSVLSLENLLAFDKEPELHFWICVLNRKINLGGCLIFLCEGEKTSKGETDSSHISFIQDNNKKELFKCGSR